ncbi:MAG: DUF1146 family protein [Lactobacillus sp.]|jgi:uncharacterized integral membrane protein (TIGR02327 family)|uniref:DUF1146 family protein n=1 Tax=Lacticaseibacillus suilingensis TaxID=2799577 RepID=A0ABW4BHL2_9LACO|nr:MULTISPECIES: DUF1146 family protein [Lacticaseibacillus]MCI1894529.1 DUF1146 family protein [Lactobacillus sp.]MCI1917656.1 DUF1146 family protein [Lactobacillus sp.]MCI1942269.1 DUF1146 family protein [Lactobacillus sp.]MCI1972689.1 DUF1146 family protein [Lactobacillus sp.]MCI2016799.1 DUF1146 family protein [Lactobacillus sp.]
MATDLGITGALTLVSHFVFIMITFRLLFALRFDKLLKAGHERESQLLMIFLAIAIGYNVSEFFLSLITAAGSLQYLIR